MIIDEKSDCLTDNETVRRILGVDKEDAWLTDSGASRHISYRREWFSNLRPSNGGMVIFGNDGECKVEGVGTIHIEKFVHGQWSEGRIENVLYVPKIRKNLFSMGACTEGGFIESISMKRK